MKVVQLCQDHLPSFSIIITTGIEVISILFSDVVTILERLLGREMATLLCNGRLLRVCPFLHSLHTIPLQKGEYALCLPR